MHIPVQAPPVWSNRRDTASGRASLGAGIGPQEVGPFNVFVKDGNPYTPCPVGHRACLDPGGRLYYCCNAAEECSGGRCAISYKRIMNREITGSFSKVY